jgi:NRPS condensation-like uncharacterized protein
MKSLSRHGWLQATAAALAVTVLAPSAQAACCYFSAKNADILQPAQKVFITFDPAKQVETFTVQPKFEGNAVDFGMVIPTPTQPKLHEMPRDFFKHLAVYSILKKRDAEEDRMNRGPSRLAFSAVDEMAELLERPDEPNLILLELAVSGPLDAGRLRTAMRAAAAALPLAWARRAGRGPWRLRGTWEIPDAPDVDALTVAAPGASLDAERARLLDTRISLRDSPVFRLLLVPGSGGAGDRLLFAAHHALFDGLSMLRVLRSLTLGYNGEPDPVPDLDVERARAVAAAAGGAGPARIGRTVTSRPVRIAPDTGPGHGGYGCVARAFDEERTAALVACARRRGVTVNDVLLTATALAVSRWNSAHGRPSGPVHVTMPVNTRPAEHRFELVSNLSRLTSVAVPPDVHDPAALLPLVAAGAREAKRLTGAAGGPAAMLLGAPFLPFALRRALVPPVRMAARRLADTTMLSNLARIPDPLPFAGAGQVTGLWMSSPAPMPRGMAVSSLTVLGRLHIAVRHRGAVLAPSAAEALTDLFTGALDEMTALPDPAAPPVGSGA